MIRLMFASVALLLALGGAVAAQTPSAAPTPALRANVTVSGDVVTIGDLVENAGPVANVPIFRAPDLGTTGAVATDRILEAIRPHQLIGIDTHGLAEVVVTRASRAIATREISARIAKALGAPVADLFGETSPDAGAIDRAAVLLSHPGALELLRAYSALPRGAPRAALVEFVKSLASDLGPGAPAAGVPAGPFTPARSAP